MNKKIDLNELSFISYVATDLDAHLDDLISVNTIIADIGSFIEYQGLQYELGYSYSNQKKKLNTLSDDIETFAKAATTGSNNNHANSDSVSDILYACVEHPFYLSLDDTIERLSKVEIDEYEVKNTNGIVSKKESWNQSGYRDYERVLNSVTYDNLNINDILKSQYSRDRMRGNYERYLQALYPNIKDISAIDADMFYESYLAGMLTLADFDHTTLLENSLNILRTTGAVLAFGTLFFTALPGAATFLGVNVGGLSIASGIVNGGLSIVDAFCLFNGTDVNGNPLTPSERDALMATVTVDAVFLSISVAGKIRYNASKGTGSDDLLNQFLADNPQLTANDFDDLIKNQSPWPKGFEPEQSTLKSGDTFQMALDSNQPLTSPGRFGTVDDITSIDFVRQDLAVKTGWKGDPSVVVTYKVKDGVEIPTLTGPVGPQIDLNANQYLKGGANQVFINLPSDVNVMDYLEIVDVKTIQ